MVHFRWYLKQYRAQQICVIACKLVIEAMNISSELQFLIHVTLACSYLQFLYTTFMLPKSVYLLV